MYFAHKLHQHDINEFKKDYAINYCALFKACFVFASFKYEEKKLYLSPLNFRSCMN